MILRCAVTTDPNRLATAIAGELRRDVAVGIEMVGAGAVNQAVKAMAIARGHLRPQGFDLWFQPSFIEVSEDRTGIAFEVERR